MHADKEYQIAFLIVDVLNFADIILEKGTDDHYSYYNFITIWENYCKIHGLTC